MLIFLEVDIVLQTIILTRLDQEVFGGELAEVTAIAEMSERFGRLKEFL